MIMIMIRIRIAKRFHHLHQSLSSTLNKPSLLLPSSSPNCYNYLTINDSRISSRNYLSSSALLSPGAKVKAKAIKEQFPLVEFCINTRLAYPNNDNDNNNDDDDDDDDDDLLEIYDGNEFCIFPPTNNNLTTTTTTKQNYNTSDNSSRHRGGYAIIGKNGCGKTLFAKSLIAEAAAASEAADGSDHGNNDSNSNPYVRSGQITINNIDSGNSDSNNSNNKYRHLRPNHPLRLKEEAKTKTSSSCSSSKIKIAHVSFDSHRQLLEERDDNSKNSSNITAFKAIAKVGNAPGKLNKAAQFLVIRFGLYPLLHRQVNTLSTGEIRKVLLVRALSIKPNILLLDNAFDGLDISSRQVLCDIVSKTIKGFTNDILVQGIDSKDTKNENNTQVIILTHRQEELNSIQEIDTIIYWDNKNRKDKNKNKNKDKQHTWNIVRRRRRPQRLCDSDRSNADDIDRDNKDDDYHNDDDDDDDDDIDDIVKDPTTGIDTSSSDLRYWSSGKEILYRAMGIELQKSLLLENNKDNDNSNSNNNWNDSSLPTKDCVRDWWKYNENQENQDQNKTDTTDGNNDKNDILVEADNLTVRAARAGGEGSDADTTIVLLHDLTWTVRKNERWIVGGGNGAGKSTLSRLLALHQNQNDDHNHDDTDDDESEINSNKSSLKILPNYNSNDNNPRNTIGWVSTETHMQQQQQQQQQEGISMITTKEFLLEESKGASFDNVIVPILFWLGIIDDTPVSASKISLLERPFHCLSQGEQKLFMIVAALALRPPLLVLDEPCQGLDIVHRRRLLQIIERICQSTSMALIYITHHLKEELVPSITHAIHLKDRRAVYCGPIVKYNPEDYYDE